MCKTLTWNSESCHCPTPLWLACDEGTGRIRHTEGRGQGGRGWWQAGIKGHEHNIPGQDLQLVTSEWHAFEAGNFHRLAGEGLLDDAPSSSAQGAHLAPVAAHHHILPHLQAAPLHNGGGHRALPLVQLGLHHHRLGCTAGAGLQVQALCLYSSQCTAVGSSNVQAGGHCASTTPQPAAGSQKKLCLCRH